ncbi:collectin-12-like, partial [Saccostrea cucullata]|uniref:collectin-12-like n=1 Tax=Saccostrea cuccullata TaxID=36930 RepID=UPI002ED0AFF5
MSAGKAAGFFTQYQIYVESCYTHNSYLVEINDLDENTWITENSLKDVFCTDPYDCTSWIGGNDKEKEGVFVWEHSKTAIGFTNWGGMNPDNYVVPHKALDCIDMAYNGKWNDRPCNFLNVFLCERDIL